MLGKLARQQDPNVLVGFDIADDAGVYQIAPDTALVQTVDFFTPIVDDPYTFGQIAATNSLSDVYAMGGRPLSSLALVCFPDKGDLDVLERILAGGLSKMIEAGCTVIGGHSIRDEEIKFGYAVTGTIHPQRVLANPGARPGDVLLFTKALGTGVISTAIKTRQSRAGMDRRRRPLHDHAQQGRRRGDHGWLAWRTNVRRPRAHRHHRLRPHRPCPRDGAGLGVSLRFAPPPCRCSPARSNACAPATSPEA